MIARAAQFPCVSFAKIENASTFPELLNAYPLSAATPFSVPVFAAIFPR